ncbi:MAG: NADH-quinone oxidoreductase subunit NuoN, partial [Alphaproteobacteria bacterium]|nr:NADH-quinone oxidoreductase subunit NuoN [Alphaproteobacteria bacterium]
KVLVLVGSALAIIISRGFLERHDMARFEYSILILFATLGMMMMISANDLISLYVGLELQSLSLYVIAAFQRDDTRSTEAGLKYFVLGAVASGMLLYGSSLIYGFTGTTNFDQLGALFEAGQGAKTSIGVIFGIVFILAGLAFKVSAVPFHMWTPDVYEGAPTPVTAFFSVAPKIAALALFIRVMIGPFGGLAADWQQIVVLVSIASMVLGAFAAINQTNIKRLMAYSSIGHIGYALIGLAVAGQGGDGAVREAGIQGVLIYMAIYLFMNVGTFACILCMRRSDHMVEDIDDLAGLSKSHPMMAVALAIFMFSMAGIPPLAGFFGKFYIFLAAVEAEMYGLAVIGVLSSVVAAFYYLRIVKVMYFDALADSLEKPIGRDMAGVLVGTSLIILLFFAWPTPLLSAAAAATRGLFAG